MSCYRRDRRVSSIMVDLNRGLYMDQATGKRLPHFDGLRQALVEALQSL